MEKRGNYSSLRWGGLGFVISCLDKNAEPSITQPVKLFMNKTAGQWARPRPATPGWHFTARPSSASAEKCQARQTCSLPCSDSGPEMPVSEDVDSFKTASVPAIKFSISPECLSAERQLYASAFLRLQFRREIKRRLSASCGNLHPFLLVPGHAFWMYDRVFNRFLFFFLIFKDIYWENMQGILKCILICI